METAFYVIYLLFGVSTGIFLLIKGREKKGLQIFGLAMLLLGAGDAFHLVPRAVGLIQGNLDHPDATLAYALGVGKLITSITMTVFYLLLYYFIFARKAKKRYTLLDVTVYLLVVARIVLCALPQNGWDVNSSDPFWGGLRNIPFTLLGLLVVVLCLVHLRDEPPYRFLFLLILLSFGFYLPVVFLAGTYPLVGLLMIPKTLCYMGMGLMAWLDYRKKE